MVLFDRCCTCVHTRPSCTASCLPTLRGCYVPPRGGARDSLKSRESSRQRQPLDGNGCFNMVNPFGQAGPSLIFPSIIFDVTAGYLTSQLQLENVIHYAVEGKDGKYHHTHHATFQLLPLPFFTCNNFRTSVECAIGWLDWLKVRKREDHHVTPQKREMSRLHGKAQRTSLQTP